MHFYMFVKNVGLQIQVHRSNMLSQCWTCGHLTSWKQNIWKLMPFGARRWLKENHGFDEKVGILIDCLSTLSIVLPFYDTDVGIHGLPRLRLLTNLLYKEGVFNKYSNTYVTNHFGMRKFNNSSIPSLH